MVMKATYRWGFCVVIMLAAAIGAAGLISRDTSAAEPQAKAPAKTRSPQTQTPTSSQTPNQPTGAPAQKAAAGQEGLVARGEYLVNNVGMCSECHTPRDADGNLDNRHYLQGAPIWIMPVQHMTNWAMRAPAIAGLEGFTDVQAQTVLEKGIGPNGIEIHPPMHIYHMNHADAQAIIAYLRSLPSNYTNP
jgi:mono/diheme cytochrome c family protein